MFSSAAHPRQVRRVTRDLEEHLAGRRSGIRRESLPDIGRGIDRKIARAASQCTGVGGERVGTGNRRRTCGAHSDRIGSAQGQPPSHSDEIIHIAASRCHIGKIVDNGGSVERQVIGEAQGSRHAWSPDVERRASSGGEAADNVISRSACATGGEHLACIEYKLAGR